MYGRRMFTQKYKIVLAIYIIIFYSLLIYIIFVNYFGIYTLFIKFP